MRAVVDRIEDDLAVMLLEPDEEIRFTLPTRAYSGIREGDIVEITITKDENATLESRQKQTDLIEKLKARKSG